MFENLKTGDINQVIITTLDRLARDTMLSLWLMKEIKKLGAELMSIRNQAHWSEDARLLP